MEPICYLDANQTVCTGNDLQLEYQNKRKIKGGLNFAFRLNQSYLVWKRKLWDRKIYML